MFPVSRSSHLLLTLPVLPTGLSVRSFSQRYLCSQSGLSDGQPPDPNRTPNSGDGGNGGDQPLRSQRNISSMYGQYR